MKTLKPFIATIAAIGMAGAAFPAAAQDSTASPATTAAVTTAAPESTELYRGNEFNIDVFASGSLNKEDIDSFSGERTKKNGRLGAGLGISYFITKNIGIGGDAYSDNTTGGFVDNASGNLIFRLPLGDTGFAPYAFGGAGYEFEEIDQAFGQAGGGLEWRLTHYVGFFVDARFVFASRSSDFGLARGGLRFSF